MSSGFGNKIKLQIFGQSHSEGLGVIIDGLPPGKDIDMERVRAFLQSRRGGKAFSTKRAETDEPVIISGLVNGKTCGAPLCCLFENKDVRSGDYSKFIPRPSHADYPAFVKYSGFADYRGGGHFSGRLTLPLSFAGAVCIQFLEECGIRINAHIASIGGIDDRLYDSMEIEPHELTDFCVLDADAHMRMLEAIKNAADAGDSIGGVVECAVSGMPAGIGEPMFDGVENRLSAVLFGIPAIKAVEFGAGFGAARMSGSEHNDEYFYESGELRFKSNNSGGILGGVTTGMPVIFRAAVKPTPSIAREQRSVDLSAAADTRLRIKGRHDPCIVPRAVPCVAAAAAIVTLDMML